VPKIPGRSWKCGGTSIPNSRGAHVQSHARFERAFDLMETQLRAGLRARDLAAAMRLPLSAFPMAFSRSVGVGPIQPVTNVYLKMGFIHCRNW
jgi:transcriptional regulator GlxA family with amidase domain